LYQGRQIYVVKVFKVKEVNNDGFGKSPFTSWSIVQKISSNLKLPTHKANSTNAMKAEFQILLYILKILTKSIKRCFEIMTKFITLLETHFRNEFA